MRFPAGVAALCVLAAAFSGTAEAQRQRRTAPAEDPKPEFTILYKKDGAPVLVALMKDQSAEVCIALLSDPASGVELTLGMNGSERTIVGVSDTGGKTPLDTARQGTSVRVTLEVDGISQIYQVRVLRERSAESNVSRATQNHIRKAISRRDGFNISVGDMPAIHFVVPREASDAFENCVAASLRSRLQERAEDLRRLVQP